MFYHVVRVREAGLKAENPVIAYFGVTVDYTYADQLADNQPAVGGTYLDVMESESRAFDMSWLENA